MQLNELKEQICDVCHKMWQLGWVAANDGNVSVRLEDGTFLCDPHGHQQEPSSRRKSWCASTGKCNVLEGLPGLQAVSQRNQDAPALLSRSGPTWARVVHAHPPTATGYAVAGVEPGLNTP